jgi:hypothetical protein
LDDPEWADEVEDESLDDYADRRRIAIVNSGRSNQRNMAGKNGGNRESRPAGSNRRIAAGNSGLQDALDSIADIASGSPDHVDDDDARMTGLVRHT